MDKNISKNNSIVYNQYWINKALEDGNSFVLISKKEDDRSIGEIIEERYLEEDLEPKSKKVTEHDSILFQREWIEKFRQEHLTIPNRRLSSKHSLGQTLSFLYSEKEFRESFLEKEKAKILKLK